MNSYILNKSISEFTRNIIFLASKKNITISTMESCTSGLLCSSLTNIEGASSVIKGGYITYSNEQKIRCGVSKEIIKNFGVYSHECSIEMAKACIERTKSDISVGITGCLGNIDKKNLDGIIGLIYFCINVNNNSFTQKIIIPDEILKTDRETQKLYIINKILIKLFDTILEYPVFYR